MRCALGSMVHSMELGQEHKGMYVNPLSQIGQLFFQPALHAHGSPLSNVDKLMFITACPARGPVYPFTYEQL